MIYHIQTYCTYGYWPEDLAPRSSRKPIITACDMCGRIRITTKHDYNELCRKCSAIKRGKETVVSDETKKKQSKSGTKRYEDPIEREKQRDRQLKRYEDPEERKKTGRGVKQAHIDDPTISQRQSESHKKFNIDNPMKGIQHSEFLKKRYGEMDDPGLEIVGHHIAYDFARPEAFKVWITNSFHGSIHHPKGTQIGNRGYSLID